MSESKEEQNENNEGQQNEPEPAQVEQTDWKAEARKWEKRAKDNREAAERASEALAEVERANARIKELEGEKERTGWINSVSAETNVPVSILCKLKAESLDELRTVATEIAAQYSHPVIPDSGKPKAPTVTRDSILAIPNEKERLEAIRNNVELFKN